MPHKLWSRHDYSECFAIPHWWIVKEQLIDEDGNIVLGLRHKQGISGFSILILQALFYQRSKSHSKQHTGNTDSYSLGRNDEWSWNQSKMLSPDFDFCFSASFTTVLS